MAKKISIEFENQPVTTGPGFSYTISIDGYDIYYSNATSELKVEFLDNGDTPVNDYDVPIGLTLDETLQITLSFLRENYINDLVSYTLTDSTIEVLVEADATIVVSELLNAYINITVTDVEPSGNNLIYYLYLDDYTLNIYKENYLGNSTEISGSFIIKKSSVDTILTPIRGTGLELSLEANQSLTFDEFLLNKEFTYKTELLKGSNIIFEGYIKPDGCQQSYVNDQWLINIESVDGLGLLKDLSFVQTNGLRFTGKMSVYDVIKACLDRTRLSMTINTSINIEYIDYTGDNILKDIYVRTERFIKDKDDSVLMDCNEVLTSMLNLFSGVITQEDGQWWIYRPNDLELNGYTTFINQDTNTAFLKNLNSVLGSQINNFYPHHCDTNQQIEVKGAISAYRINYEYGFLEGFLKNPNLNHDEDLVYTDWETSSPLPSYVTIINDPLSNSGIKVQTKLPSAWVPPLPLPDIGIVEILTSTPIEAVENQVFAFRAKVSSKNIKCDFKFQIMTSDGYYLNIYNQWVTNPAAFVKVTCGSHRSAEVFKTFELLIPPVLNDCYITVVICAAQIRPRATFPFENGVCTVNYVELVDNEIQNSGIIGEFHTVSRLLPPSSITKENQKVFNGDGDAVLIGGIFKEDQEELTDLWSRKNKFENLPLLGISAMDDLRIQSNPIKVFSGNVYGRIPYMSVVTIDNVLGLFMPIEYDYAPKSNKSTIKLLQFYNSDLGDIEYTVSPDYGKSTIKPTIKG